ncbi:hypothetical protein ACO2J8_00825 [Leptospira interrogans]|uniref:Uncharacterized protein n=10 Tax=Leptospira interrogans TaxID=173 RepID=A0A0E2D8Y0_LEPIR|nr:hypothetical protein [Leptospira interrogans]EJP01905.1 hypothetical protein LEP1GSC007_3637 [Leptospira interrogans serovar Bulgarica str. Mallika]EJP14178.1 hypothetical protein LEP1GSC080_4491 [Leptospira interrogans str. FPW2026]EKN88069.1 hypothetical protein LEP1GSC027_3818 [Leptospira interrogans str. 2002000624]EKN96501.1 hypothetical protein LEP1GSC014_3686 [Leptospira interrogans serovar Pomona str. Pomona]EKO05404.1 hypothetical protein LEP1GSC077_0583 [Leptospira interrogans str
MIFHDSCTFLPVYRSFLQTDFLFKKSEPARAPGRSYHLNISEMRYN